jgi:neopullulanase
MKTLLFNFTPHMKKIFFFLYYTWIVVGAFAQNQILVYPTNWFVQMKMNNLQLMFHQEDRSEVLAYDKLTITCSSADIKIKKINTVENPRYVFVDIAIAPTAKPQTVQFYIKSIGRPTLAVPFTLLPRRSGNATSYAQGVTSADLVYLILPDRFSNGDTTNDKVPGMLDQSLRRDTVFNRHGGDLKGIQNHLNYLKELGVTTLWLNPVIENNMPQRTEHGYAFTNHYKIDVRLGGIQAYKNLVDAAHAKGLKIIQDAVYNHVGIQHFFIKDLPMKNWVHQWPSYTNTSFKDQVVFDPYASSTDRKKMSEGWFEPNMADLNQNNPYLANFLIQHAIWTVETFGIDGWRIDTYAYNDLTFMNRCNKALYDEYPAMSIFGETWVHGVPNQSYFCENNYTIPYKSNLQATTDFQLLFYGIQAALTQPFGWTEGLNKLYNTTAQDFVYKNPMRQVIFLDNHDLPRFYSVLNEDTAKYKMALAWLLTFRGIPQLYYGNEILMEGTTSPNDGYVRLDFKGGWLTDSVNKFTAAGRTAKENDVFNYLTTLANFRKNSPALTTGKLMQYVPEDGVYVYFRYNDRQTVMCVVNPQEKPSTIRLERFVERMKGFTKAYNIATQQSFTLDTTLTIPAKNLWVLALKKIPLQSQNIDLRFCSGICGGPKACKF